MRVVLIGEEFAGSENLALAMLEASLEARGHRVFRVPLGSLLDLEATALQALSFRPALIGLSINYQLTALTALAVGHRLRAAGYRGHLTAGGEFATIHPEEILRDCPLDSLIRFEGERPLADLADALSDTLCNAHADSSSALTEIPGLILADGSKPAAAQPARVWDRPFPFWAARPPASQPRQLGIPSAAILGSRGCSYHCVYCCIASLNRTAKRQAKAAGRLQDWVKTRQRPPSDLADEMAHLRRAHGVRLFRFEDDCLLGNDPHEAIAILDALARELDRRRVDDIALTLKLRPDSLDRAVVRKLASLGLIHAFIGVEALTDATLKRLGRSYRSAAAEEALAALGESGIPAYFNALIIGPDATLETLAADVAALEGHSRFPVEIVRLILYQGTPMFRGLEARGAVRGNYLHWRYAFADPGVEVVARLLAHLPTRRTGTYGVAKRLADLELNLAVARRFYPHVATGAIATEIAALKRASNLDTVALIRRLIAIAADRPSEAEQLRIAAQIAAETTPHDQAVFARIDALVARLEVGSSLDGKLRRTAYLRSGLAAAGVCFQLAFAPVGAPIEDGSHGLSSPPQQAQTSQPSSAPDTLPSDGPSPDASSTLPPPEAATSPTAPTCDETLTDSEGTARRDEAAYGCGVADFCDAEDIIFALDGDGRVVHVKTAQGALPPAERTCILDALAGVCFPDVSDELVHHFLYGPCD